MCGVIVVVVFVVVVGYSPARILSSQVAKGSVLDCEWRMMVDRRCAEVLLITPESFVHAFFSRQFNKTWMWWDVVGVNIK